MNTNAAARVLADDAIHFKIYVARVVPLADVKVSARFETTINPREDQLEQEGRLLRGLNSFIEADWHIEEQKVINTTPASQQIEILAISKIPAGESHNLHERAARVKPRDLKYFRIESCLDWPQDKVSQIIDELRYEVVATVVTQIEKFNAASNRKWHIGNIAFGTPSGEHPSVWLIKGARVESSDDSFVKLIESRLFGIEKSV